MNLSKRLVAIGVLGALFPAARLDAQNIVVDWNNIATTTIVTNGQKASITAGVWFAYVQLAVYDAVNAIDRRHEPYLFATNAPRGASKDAAATAAAYRILVHYFPSQSDSLDAHYASSIAGLTDSPQSTADGLAVGERTARALIAARAHDGLEADVSYAPSAGAGNWQPTPSAFAPPLTAWLGEMRPFSMKWPEEFLPHRGPTPLNRREWIEDYNLTKSLGSLNSTIRTPEQTETGLFWTEHTAQQYARAFRRLADNRALDTAETARLFAMLWTGFADAGIACWNAKYKFGFWRPVTAIRAGGDNPQLTADPEWTPLASTPAHPEYPAAHGCATGVIARVLRDYFRTPKVPLSVSSTVTNTSHEFDDVTELQREVFGARIYAGFHYRHSLMQGFEIGLQVARNMSREFFREWPKDRKR
jgi:hypothetical protein